MNRGWSWRRAARRPGFEGSLSNDFNAESATASAAIGSVSHRIPGRPASPGAGPSGGSGSPVTRIQLEAQRVVEATAGDRITVFGTGIVNDEFSRVIFDSLAIVVPAAALLILLFLVVAFRDPFDLLGVVSLVMTVIRTFGFTGLARIPFSQLLIAVPPLLLAVRIDFGIHSVNRYREELGEFGREEEITITLRQLLVAF